MPAVYSRRGGPRTPRGAVDITRPSIWGNPFVVGKDGVQGECVEKYREWINRPEQATLRARMCRELRGRDLVCVCKPEPCHGDVILEVIARGDDLSTLNVL